MLTLLSSIALLLVPVLPAQTSDVEVFNVHGGMLRGVAGSTFEADSAWVVGEGGLIRKLSGSMWSHEQTPDDVESNVVLEGIHVIHDDDMSPLFGRGWAVGDRRTVLRRASNGIWTRVDKGPTGPMPAGSADDFLYDVFFIEVPAGEVVCDPSPCDDLAWVRGWIVGSSGIIWRVLEGYDAGGVLRYEEWASQNQVVLPMPELSLPAAVQITQRLSVHVVREPDGPLHVYVGGVWGLLLHSDDLGETWTRLDVDGYFACPPPPESLTCGRFGNFQIWDVEVTLDGTGAATGGAFHKGKAGWVVGIDDWTVVTTGKLGAMGCAPPVWAECNTPTVPCNDPDQPIAGCGGPPFTNLGGLAYGLCTLTDDRQLCVGYVSDAWRSPVGPPVPSTPWEWESVYEPPLGGTLPILADVALARNSSGSFTVYSAGHHGTIRRSQDAEMASPTWENVAGDFTVRLQAVDFISDQVGWVSGQGGGLIMRTDDGGGSLVLETPTPLGGTLVSIDMVHETLGMAVGFLGGGAFVAARNGEAWYSATPGFDGPITAVEYATTGSRQRFWAVGADSQVKWTFPGVASLSWMDGGLAGSEVSLEHGLHNLRGLAVLNANESVVVGEDGFAAWSEMDGGVLTWRKLPVFNGGVEYVGTLTDVDLGQTNELIAVGHDGTDSVVFQLTTLNPHAASAPGPPIPVIMYLKGIHEEPGVSLNCIEIDPCTGDVYAGGEEGAFLVRRDGVWSRHSSRTSTEIPDIATVPSPCGEGGRGFLVSQHMVINRFEVSEP